MLVCPGVRHLFRADRFSLLQNSVAAPTPWLADPGVRVTHHLPSLAVSGHYPPSVSDSQAPVSIFSRSIVPSSHSDVNRTAFGIRIPCPNPSKGLSTPAQLFSSHAVSFSVNRWLSHGAVAEQKAAWTPSLRQRQSSRRLWMHLSGSRGTLRSTQCVGITLSWSSRQIDDLLGWARI